MYWSCGERSGLKNMTPQVSLVIPVWQHERLLANCLASLGQQTFKDFEIIIIDDGNDPPLNLEPITYHLEPRLIRQEHAGAAVARNRGAREARGEFLLFVDADSELYPDCLERMVEALHEYPETAFAYSSFKWGWKEFRARAFDPVTLRRHNIAHTASLLRRRDFPGFDESLKKFQDWDLWLTLLDQGKRGVAISETLFRINPRGGTMSTWAPSFWYQIPWSWLRLLWPGVRVYEIARAIIINKHQC